MEELQPFARSLRELMAHHPKDGRVTTPAELAEELGTSKIPRNKYARL